MARELIAEHGDGVVDFVQAKVDEFMRDVDAGQLLLWGVVRNCVTISLQSGGTLQ